MPVYNFYLNDNASEHYHSPTLPGEGETTARWEDKAYKRQKGKIKGSSFFGCPYKITCVVDFLFSSSIDSPIP